MMHDSDFICDWYNEKYNHDITFAIHTSRSRTSSCAACAAPSPTAATSVAAVLAFLVPSPCPPAPVRSAADVLGTASLRFFSPSSLRDETLLLREVDLFRLLLFVLRLLWREKSLSQSLSCRFCITNFFSITTSPCISETLGKSFMKCGCDAFLRMTDNFVLQKCP